MSYKVTRCVCQNHDFKEIKAIASKMGYVNVDQLKEQNICAVKCEMCAPYVELMLATGETEFEPSAYRNRKEAG